MALIVRSEGEVQVKFYGSEMDCHIGELDLLAVLEALEGELARVTIEVINGKQS